MLRFMFQHNVEELLGFFKVLRFTLAHQYLCYLGHIRDISVINFNRGPHVLQTFILVSGTEACPTIPEHSRGRVRLFDERPLEKFTCTFEVSLPIKTLTSFD